MPTTPAAAGSPSAGRAGNMAHADLAAHRVHAGVRGADGRVRCTRDGERRALLGDPLVALTWLANELSFLGIGLRAGDWASCGTCMVPPDVLPGDRVVADYGTFGRIEIAVTDRGAIRAEPPVASTASSESSMLTMP